MELADFASHVLPAFECKGQLVQVRDMSLNEQDGKLVACSCNNSFVGVWVVDLNKIRPFSGPAVRHKAPHALTSTYCLLQLHSCQTCVYAYVLTAM